MPKNQGYISLRASKLASLLPPLRERNVSQAMAAARINVPLRQYRAWESGTKVPPFSARAALSKCIYDWSNPKESFVLAWTGIAEAWGWPPIGEAELTVHQLADRQVERAERRDLDSDWKSVLLDRSCLVRFIDGDHGEGKTTLAHRFLLDAVNSNPQAIVATYSCPDIATPTGYDAASELLSQVVQQLMGPSMQERNAFFLLQDMLHQAPAWRQAILEGAERAARPCASRESRETGTSPIFRKNQRESQYLDLIFKASERPILLFLDNLQWADSSSLNLLLYFIRASAKETLPVYLLAAYRHFEAYLPLSEDAPFPSMHLEALRESHVRALRFHQGVDLTEYLAKRYPGQQFPNEVLRLLYLATRGNPYLLSNVLFELDRIGKPRRMLKEQFSHLMQDWHESLKTLLTDAAPQASKEDFLTSTIVSLREKIEDAILKTRLSRLDRNSLKALLDQAAVEWKVGGEGFSREVAQACAVDKPYVYLDLRDLEDKYLLIRAHPASAKEAQRLTLYEFWYWLYGSYIYAKVPPDVLPELHLRVAECLGVLYSNTPGVKHVLAEHYARANRPLQAASYGLEAARAEASRSAWAEVEQLCSSGLKWLQGIEGQEAAHIRMGILYQLGKAYYNNGDYKNAAEELRQAVKEAKSARLDPYQKARLYAYLAEAREASGLYPSAMVAVNAGRSCLQKQQGSLEEVGLWLDILTGLLLCREDRTDEAMLVLQKVVKEGEALPAEIFTDFVRVRAYNCLAITYSYMDRCADSTRYFGMAMEVAMRSGDWSMLADIKVNLAEDDIFIGNFDEAEALLAEALADARRAQDTDAEAWALGMQGKLYLESGRPAEALESLARTTELLEKMGQQESEPIVFADLALAHLAAHDCESALKVARRAQKWAVTRLPRGFWFDALAQVELGCSRPISDARLHFEAAIGLFDEAGSRQLGGRSRRRLAQLLIETGESAQAFRLLSDALITFRELSLPLEITQTELLLDTLNP